VTSGFEIRTGTLARTASTCVNRNQLVDWVATHSGHLPRQSSTAHLNAPVPREVQYRCNSKSNEAWSRGRKLKLTGLLWPELRFIPRRPCCLRAAVWVFLWKLLHCAPFPANPQLGIWGPCVRPFPSIKVEENSSIDRNPTPRDSHFICLSPDGGLSAGRGEKQLQKPQHMRTRAFYCLPSS
jgi:hypothetical protein